MALLTIWNSTILGFNSKAILPYAQGLSRFPAHIQQLDMESNGILKKFIVLFLYSSQAKECLKPEMLYHSSVGSWFSVNLEPILSIPFSSSFIRYSREKCISKRF